MRAYDFVNNELDGMLNRTKAIHINVFLYYCSIYAHNEDVMNLVVDSIYDLVSKRKFFFCGNGYIRKERFTKIDEKIMNYNRCLRVFINSINKKSNNKLVHDDLYPRELSFSVNSKVIGIFNINSDNKNYILPIPFPDCNIYYAIVAPYEDISEYQNPLIKKFYFVDNEYNITNTIKTGE